MSMGQRLLQRRFAQTAARLKELRLELLVVADQMSHMVDDANDLSLRALVSETPSAEFEYRESKKHADVVVRHHGQLVAEIADLEGRMNDLLDRMKEHSS